MPTLNTSLNNHVIVSLLTGRGNNTLRDKNILPVAGKPLLYYPATAAKKSQYIKHFFVSSDDDKILDIAANIGYEKIKRPVELARPDSPHVDCIVHALQIMEEKNIRPTILLVLLANCATTKTKWINESIEMIINNPEISAVVPVIQDQDHHPYRAKRLDDQGFLQPHFDFNKENISTNRQDLKPNFFLCHNFWVLHVIKSINDSEGQAPWKFMGHKIKPYPVTETFDVHDRNDLVRTEQWLVDNEDVFEN